MKTLRKLYSMTFACILAVGVSFAQNHNLTEAAQPQGKTIVFRFVADDDTFYIPYQGNGDKLTELVATIDHYKSAITAGEAKLNVDGYCSSYPTAKENLKSATVRANRVKSELIVRNSITEADFATTVYATPFEGRKSVVVVTLIVPQISEPAKPQAVVEQPKSESKPAPVAEQPKREPEPTKELAPEPIQIANTNNSHFALRTNLLYWLAAMPNLGVEYKTSQSIGVLVNGAWSHWSWKGGDRQHKVWMVSPEVRWYLGETKRWFVGAEFHVGEFNFKFNDTGRQGKMIGGGITGGYSLPLSRAFNLDFSLGLGYTKLDYDSYTQSNSVYVKKETGLSKNLFAPTQAGVSLVWKIGK